MPRRPPRPLLAAALLLALAGCGQERRFDDSPENIHWREILASSGVGDPWRQHYPRIAELSLTEAAAVLSTCSDVEPSCADDLLAAHPALRGEHLRSTWPRALGRMQPQLAAALLERGALADSAAMAAAMRRDARGREARLAIIALLLKAGAPVDPPEPLAFGIEETPLQQAAREGDEALVQLLLSHGADTGRRSRKGLTAQQLAQAQGCGPCVALLQKAAGQRAMARQRLAPAAAADQFSPPGGEFSVRTPQPLAHSASTQAFGEHQVLLHRYRNELDGIGVAVNLQTLPATQYDLLRLRPRAELIERAREALAAQVDGVVEWQRAVQLQGVPGMEFVLRQRDGSQRMIAREFWVGAGFLQATALLPHPATVAQEAQALAFLDSLSVPQGDIVLALRAPLGEAPPPAPRPASHAAGDDLFITTEVDEPRPQVGAAVHYRLRLHHALPLIDSQLLQPPQDGLRWQPLANPPPTTQRLGGRDYTVVERNFLVFPQRPGPLLVAAPHYRGRVRLGPAPDSPVGVREVHGASVELAVQPPVVEGAPPARSLALQRTLLGSPPYRVGEPIILQLELRARGLDGEAYAALPAPGIDTHAARIGLTERALDDDPAWPELRLTQRIELLPAEPGRLRLPALQQPWFNVLTGLQETAEVGALSIEVEARR
jgi:hypothetical protein